MKEIYWIVTASCLVFALFLPQHGPERKRYIIVMAVIHSFISAFRYRFLTGDLLKYNTEFQDVHYFGFFSSRVLHGGKNTLFYWMMKFLCDITGGYFPSLLIVTSIFIEIVLAVFIYRYSPRPWLSYLVWNCIGFYIFGFSAVKQSFAMAFVVLATIAILEDNPKRFAFWAVLAGCLHFPAFVFLPAYWIAKRQINFVTIAIYIFAGVVIFLLNNPIVTFMSSLYYEEDEFSGISDVTLGGRFAMMIIIIIVAILIKDFSDKRFSKLFNLMIMAALIQMFSGYDNVFTRLTDYYFQFSVIFIPMMFSSEETESDICSPNRKAFFPFDEQSLRILVLLLSITLIWYYNTSNLARPIQGEHDYLNYHFDWDPEADEWRT